MDDQLTFSKQPVMFAKVLPSNTLASRMEPLLPGAAAWKFKELISIEVRLGQRLGLGLGLHVEVCRWARFWVRWRGAGSGLGEAGVTDTPERTNHSSLAPPSPRVARSWVVKTPALTGTPRTTERVCIRR